MGDRIITFQGYKIRDRWLAAGSEFQVMLPWSNKILFRAPTMHAAQDWVMKEENSLPEHLLFGEEA
ncbi:hypothetical protein [Acetobacter malorum]|nr:hypothetical protein [Acetobacter malorum]